MPFFYLSLMSSRLFHSKDIDGLRQALTDDPAETHARPEPQTSRPARSRKPARIIHTHHATADT